METNANDISNDNTTMKNDNCVEQNGTKNSSLNLPSNENGYGEYLPVVTETAKLFYNSDNDISSTTIEKLKSENESENMKYSEVPANHKEILKGNIELNKKIIQHRHQDNSTTLPPLLPIDQRNYPYFPKGRDYFFLLSTKGNEHLIYQKHRYRREKLQGERTYWVCVVRFCHGRLTVNSNGEIENLHDTHPHAPRGVVFDADGSFKGVKNKSIYTVDPNSSLPLRIAKPKSSKKESTEKSSNNGNSSPSNRLGNEPARKKRGRKPLREKWKLESDNTNNNNNNDNIMNGNNNSDNGNLDDLKSLIPSLLTMQNQLNSYNSGLNISSILPKVFSSSNLQSFDTTFNNNNNNNNNNNSGIGSINNNNNNNNDDSKFSMSNDYDNSNVNDPLTNIQNILVNQNKQSKQSVNPLDIIRKLQLLKNEKTFSEQLNDSTRETIPTQNTQNIANQLNLNFPNNNQNNNEGNLSNNLISYLKNIVSAIYDSQTKNNSNDKSTNISDYRRTPDTINKQSNGNQTSTSELTSEEVDDVENSELSSLKSDEQCSKRRKLSTIDDIISGNDNDKYMKRKISSNGSNSLINMSLDSPQTSHNVDADLLDSKTLLLQTFLKQQQQQQQQNEQQEQNKNDQSNENEMEMYLHKINYEKLEFQPDELKRKLNILLNNINQLDSNPQDKLMLATRLIQMVSNQYNIDACKLI
ncbi:hypothetical protein SNEBB_001173 [Seison nebaliae]|nr:hypothetical protein SNEBB_001173 [Seison nebaliae]